MAYPSLPLSSLVSAGPKATVVNDPKQRPKRWKTIGYPVFAELVGSDNELFILRRFSTLNARVILGMQDNLCELETKLNTIDDRCKNAENDIDSGTFRYEQQDDRRELLKDIKDKLRDYNEFVTLHSALKALPLVVDRQVENLKNWHEKNEGAIDKDEASYIKETSDLITIVPIAKTPLRRVLDRTTWFSTSRLFRRVPTTNNRSYDKEIIYYHSDNRMQAFDSGIIMLIGLAMLIAPLWILYHATGGSTKLGIITAFVTTFLVLVQATTVAKPYETLAAVAA